MCLANPAWSATQRSAPGCCSAKLRSATQATASDPDPSLRRPIPSVVYSRPFLVIPTKTLPNPVEFFSLTLASPDLDAVAPFRPTFLPRLAIPHYSTPRVFQFHPRNLHDFNDFETQPNPSVPNHPAFWLLCRGTPTGHICTTSPTSSTQRVALARRLFTPANPAINQRRHALESLAGGRTPDAGEAQTGEHSRLIGPGPH